MDVTQTFRAELDAESGPTRKMLEAVPEAHFDWKPHPKSMSLRLLASHLAEIPHWASAILDEDSIDIATASYVPWSAASREELIAAYDRNLAAARAALEGRADGDFARTWTMKVDGKVQFTLPKTAVFRSFVLSHSIHHRAQLGVYLRLKDVPLPSVYGPTADDVMTS